MHLVLTLQTPPDTEPVTVAEAKTHSRIFISNDDDYIGDLIEAARIKWETDTGWYIAQAVYQATVTRYHKHFVLPLRPVAEVTTINSLVEDTDYSVSIDVRTGEAVIKLLTNITDESLVITFTVGEETPSTLAKHAIKTLISHWYENRESFQAGSEYKSVPATYQSIVNTFRIA